MEGKNVRTMIMHSAGTATTTMTGHSRLGAAVNGERPVTSVMRSICCMWGKIGRCVVSCPSSLRLRGWAIWLRFGLIAALVFIWVSSAQAQRGSYPSAPVRVIVGFPPGGGVDVAARLVAQKMAGLWGQPVLVENRPGAASGIATRFVAGAAPDGYTVLINSNSMVVNQIANPDAGYDIERQLIPIINVAWQPTIIVAAQNLPVSSLADVISLSRKRKLSYGTPGQGSIPHLAGAYLFNMLSKADILHVPYKGAAPALSGLAGSQIDLAFVTLPPAIPLVRSGRVKAVAVTSAKRTASLPDIPTVAESGFPGYVVNVFAGFFMPVGAPKAVVDTFRENVLTVMAMADIKEKLANLGFEEADAAKENFPRLVSDEIKQWVKVVKEANIKIE
jgi:tripartite-type tricarboxylate transporter receptor subunit TctC